MEKFKFLSKNKISQIPKNSGVYAFKKGEEILYIGKAANLRERVKNHFQQQGYRDYLFLNKVEKIGYIKTNSTIEALILEANLIKKYQPKYNVVWRDDKNYFFVGITRENYPRVFITHQTKLKIENCKLKIDYVGPFVDGKALKATLKILRRVFPYRTCKNLPKKPCLWYHLGRCPAPCQIKIKDQRLKIKEINKIKESCRKNVKNLFKILQGKKALVLKNLKKEMSWASKNQNFELAAKIRDQIGALEIVLAHAKISEETTDLIRLGQDKVGGWRELEKKLREILKTKNKIERIEAYDVSNIQGKEAAGSMVTFINGRPAKNFYRRFKIKTPHQGPGGGPNDIAMLKEVLWRRFKHPEWPEPDLILIDGGKAQLNAVVKIKNQHPVLIKSRPGVIALAKKKNELFIEGKKKPVLLKNLPREIFNLILQLRDEAHRFARKYHLKLREIDLNLKP